MAKTAGWKAANAIIVALISGFLLLFYGMIYFGLSSTLEYTGFLLGLSFLFVGLVVEARRMYHPRYSFKQDIELIAATLFGGLATFALSTYDVGFNGLGNMGPVIAAGLVGLMGAEILQRLEKSGLAPPMYCGAFVGMSSAAIYSFPAIAGASFLAAVIYAEAHEIYAGSGGTLGTIAFIGTTIAKKIFG